MNRRQNDGHQTVALQTKHETGLHESKRLRNMTHHHGLQAWQVMPLIPVPTEPAATFQACRNTWGCEAEDNARRFYSRCCI